MIRRFLLTHGVPVALAAWTTAAIAIGVVGQRGIAVDALIGGTPRTIHAADIFCALLAATLPGTVRSRMNSWEQNSTTAGLRAGKAGLATTVLLAAPALAWPAHSTAAPNGTVCLGAAAMILTALGAVNAAAPVVLAGYVGCVAIVQHVPSAVGTPNPVLTTAIAGVAVAAYAAGPQRVSRNFAGRPSLRASVASAKLSVRIRR